MLWLYSASAYYCRVSSNLEGALRFLGLFSRIALIWLFVNFFFMKNDTNKVWGKEFRKMWHRGGAFMGMICVLNVDTVCGLNWYDTVFLCKVLYSNVIRYLLILWNGLQFRNTFISAILDYFLTKTFCNCFLNRAMIKLLFTINFIDYSTSASVLWTHLTFSNRLLVK